MEFFSWGVDFSVIENTFLMVGRDWSSIIL